MKKKCLACSKEWFDGVPYDGLISHGICSDYCRVMLELWTFSGSTETLKEFTKRKEQEHAHPSGIPPKC